MITKDTKVGDVLTNEDGETATVMYFSQYAADKNFVLLIAMPTPSENSTEIVLNACLFPASLDPADESLKELAPVYISVECQDIKYLDALIVIAENAINSRYYASMADMLCAKLRKQVARESNTSAPPFEMSRFSNAPEITGENDAIDFDHHAYKLH